MMLRRLKSHVEVQLPQRTINHYFVEMDGEQRSRYTDYEDKVARLVRQARHRPLHKDEFEKLQGWLACLRMLCDIPDIFDSEYRKNFSKKVAPNDLMKSCLSMAQAWTANEGDVI